MVDADKWGIPFFYATAADAGVSGTGSGFFWQQNNDIFVDNRNGMVRLGKEQDDVEVISTTTGEWEFPFDSGAEYFCMEGRQGHKSGGEEHGCEGSCYIANVTINETPPRFYFQKQMYHGGPKFTHSSGKFTHSKVIEKVVGNGFKGFAFVIYSRENGRATGKDSAILEIWWNEDPVNNLKGGWFKVKQIEDKTGWGNDGDSCNGDNDQVINWSNIQFRYKSGTPDFSLHPRKPEYEDGPVIHSIGEEDMDFAACEKRGYGYRQDMPRDFEMKCLFKFTANDGICRLKNLSLREIDGFKAIDDTPDQPDSAGQPAETQTITGKFKLQWDLNTVRDTSSCAGISAPEIFYDIPTEISKPLSNHTEWDYRTRAAEKVQNSSSVLHGKIIKQIDIPLKKTGSPGASPTVRMKIWGSDGETVVYTSPTSLDPSAFTTSFVTKTFDFSTNTHVMVTGEYVGVEYTGGDDNDYVGYSYQDSNTIGDTYYHQYNNDLDEWWEYNSRELSCTMYE